MLLLLSLPGEEDWQWQLGLLLLPCVVAAIIIYKHLSWEGNEGVRSVSRWGARDTASSMWLTGYAYIAPGQFFSC